MTPIEFWWLQDEEPHMDKDEFEELKERFGFK